MKYLFGRVNVFVVALCLLTFAMGWRLGHMDLSLQWTNYKPSLTLRNEQPPKDTSIDFALFWNTWDLVSKEYFDKKAVDPKKMYYGAIQGMVAALGDPYTVFLPPESQKATKEELGGSFEGVGIQLGFSKEKRLVVIAPLEGTPAYDAGIESGDMILKIDDKETTALSLPEAVTLIRGPKGTTVNLEIYREGEKKPRDVELKRDTIVVKSVDFSIKTTPEGQRAAYIKLSRFGEKTNAEWSKAVSDTLASAPSGVILDLRNNPGGFLESSVFIGSEFIESGDVVLQENSKGVRQGFKVNRVGKLLKLPLVVLINKGSASASEIVAGAIQDHKRGTLMGEQSFGKGTIQESQELPDGTGIHITKAKWLTPDGRWIHEKGLTPDVKIEPGDDDGKDEKNPKNKKDSQLDKALEVLDIETSL